MIRINLLPIRQLKRKKRLQQEVAFFAILVAVLLIGLLFVGMGLTRRVSTLQKEISALETEKVKYNQIIAEIKQLEAAQALLEKKIAVIRDLKKNSQINVRVLDELARATQSQRLWLNSLQYSGNRLVISGVALDNATIAQLMERLIASDYFTEADLASSTSTVIGGNKLQSFSLTITVITPAPAEQPAG
jgi:type IV pilus assembly protein PilN